MENGPFKIKIFNLTLDSVIIHIQFIGFKRLRYLNPMLYKQTLSADKQTIALLSL